MTPATGRTNAALSGLLFELGWTSYDLARRINHQLGVGYVHRTTPRSWCRLGVTPRPPLPAVVAKIISDELGRVVTVEELWPDLLGAPGPIASDQGLVSARLSREVGHIVLNLDLASSGGRLVCVSGSDLFRIVRRWDSATVSAMASPVDTHWLDGLGDPIVRHLEDDLPRLRSIDDQSGGQALLTLVEHQQRALASLLAQFGIGTWRGRQALNVLAQYCQFAGWLALDMGRHAQAQRYLFMSVELGAAVGNSDLVNLAVSCLGVQAINRSRPQDARDLLTLTTHSAPHSNGAAAIFWTRRARASAAVGNVADCERSLDEARRRLAAPAEFGDPRWTYWLTPAVLDAEEGRCRIDLGTPNRARRHLTTVILAPQVAARDRVLYGAALAQAHLASGDLDQAYAELHDSSAFLPATSSRRCRDDLSAVHRDLSGQPLDTRRRQGLARVALALREEPDNAGV